MFLLVISVNHTNTIAKVSSWILLIGKSLTIGSDPVRIYNIRGETIVSQLLHICVGLCSDGSSVAFTMSSDSSKE